MWIVVGIILVFVSPFLSGMAGVDGSHFFPYSKIYIKGIMLHWGIFEVVCVIGALSGSAFHIVLGEFLAIILFINFIILFRKIEIIKQLFVKKKRGVIHFKLYYVIVIIVVFLIAIQTLVLTVGQHIDMDDASYITASTTTVETDSIYQYNQQTGELNIGLDAKRVLSSFPQYLAYLAVMLEVHPAIIARTLYPLWAIPFSYVIYGLLGNKLFINSKNEKWLFMLFLCIYNIFGYSSIYTSSSFMLLRIWQGKATLTAILLPTIWYLISEIAEGKSKTDWLYLEMSILAACMTTTMGVMLATISCVLFLIAYGGIRKEISIVYKGVLCCVPCVILAGIYLVMR